MKRQRPRYPRIACSVPSCTRGTTTCEPSVRIICGKCWRKAPVALRQEFSRWRRKATALDKIDDPRAETCHRRASLAWERILQLFANEAPDGSDALPPLVAEQLRKDGLLDA